MSVQRHRTIPMTKRESVSTTGSRLSLISNTSNASNQKHLDEKGSASTKRTKKVERTESYKRAIERQSVYEDLYVSQEERAIQTVSKSREDDDRRKYNTLPLRRETNNNEMDNSTCNHKAKKEKHSPFVVRNSSVKSGTYPSPDTDDDQYSVEPERKKKSTFKRFKERLILTFRKDDKERKRRREKEKYLENQNKKSGGKKSFRSFDIEKTIQDKNGTYSKHHHSSEHNAKVHNGSVIEQTIMKDANKKYPDYFKQWSRDTHKKNSGEDQTKQLISHVSTNCSFLTDEKSSSHMSDTYRDNTEKQTYVTCDDHNSKVNHKIKSNENEQQSSKAVGGDKFINTDSDEVEDQRKNSIVDLTTDIFGQIIHPSSRPVCARQPSWGRQQEDLVRPKGADRSKLKLEGLRKNTPNSVDNSPLDVQFVDYQRQTSVARGQKLATFNKQTNLEYISSLPHSVETDGPDYADGIAENGEDIADFSDSFIDADVHVRKVTSVAQCLKIIADRLIEEKPRSVTEDEIVQALREIADDVDRQMFQRKDMPVPRELFPAMRNIIMAKSYTSFIEVIKQETAKTVGWDQVAWYTFLAKSALQITGLGGRVGKMLHDRVMRYFKSTIRPFVDSRPYGWESIHEETDMESELD